MDVITRSQREALHRVWKRTIHSEPNPLTYREFRKTARLWHVMNCVMVPWAGMLLGIEADGHTHS